MTNNEFEKISKHFEKLISIYLQKGDSNRASSFSNALKNIKEKLEEIEKEEELEDFLESDLLSIRGVGASTVKEIQEVVATGTSKRLIELEGKEEGVKSKSFDSSKFLKSF